MHPYTWLSLLPPVAAIVLAIVTRRAVVSLLAGILVGSLITTGGNPVTAVSDMLEVHLWRTFTEPGKLRVFSFTLLMGAMIGVIQRSGGMRGLIELVKPFAHTRRSGQLTTWVSGLVIFFDDYANTLLLGSTLRPLCDRLRISREKLAYIVDSTAAPVSGLALVSTWVAVEIDYVREGIENLAEVSDFQAFDLFLASIPYRFYMLMALFFVPLTALLGRDFGPMLHAERERAAGADDLKNDSTVSPAEIPAAAGRWYHAVLPIAATLAVVLGLLLITGRQVLEERGEGAPGGYALRDVFGAAESSLALQYGALAGLLLAVLLARGQRLLTWPELDEAIFRGVRVVLPAIAILWCATTLSRMTGNRSAEGEVSTTAFEFRDHRLYTGDFLKQLIAPDDGNQPAGDAARPSSATLPVAMLPTIVFLLASVVSFCTGTSFGTMGILTPMVIPLAHAMLSTAGAAVSPSDPILLCTVGSVLAGSVFGDHCSPISDTTILSSISSGCDHISHVRTQLPYAITVAGVCVLVGTLPIGLGAPVSVLLLSQMVALVFFLLIVGKKVDDRPQGS